VQVACISEAIGARRGTEVAQYFGGFTPYSLLLSTGHAILDTVYLGLIERIRLARSWLYSICTPAECGSTEHHHTPRLGFALAAPRQLCIRGTFWFFGSWPVGTLFQTMGKKQTGASAADYRSINNKRADIHEKGSCIGVRISSPWHGRPTMAETLRVYSATVELPLVISLFLQLCFCARNG